MLDSFIHFLNLNLNKLTLYFQNDDEVKVMEKMTIEDLENIHTMPSRLNIFLPSSLFGFKRFKNPSNLKVDHLKALFFSEIEDRLISDISKLKFFYFNDLSLASWIDLDKYQSLLETLNLIDSDIYLYPEHFLLPSKKNTIYINDKFFIFADEDGDGFSGGVQSLDNYLEALKVDGKNLETIDILVEDKNLMPISSLSENFKVTPIAELRNSFLAKNISATGNIFERNFSFNFLKSKFKFTKYENLFIVSALSIIFFLPLIINLNLSTSINTYNQQTEQIFKKLNPNFNQLVNPKAQIDNLITNIPENNSLSQQNLDVISYIERLSDEAVKLVDINFLNNTITLSIENLPSYKMSLFRELVKNEPLTFNSSGLIQKEKALFGQLVINYDPT